MTGNRNDLPLVIGLIFAVVIGGFMCLSLGAAWVYEQANGTRLTDEQRLMGEIQATTAAMINDARDRQSRGDVALAQAVSGNGGGMLGAGGAGNDAFAILALVAVVLFMAVVLFALAKKG